MHNFDKKPSFWKLEEPGCLYSISEQKFRHRSAGAAALFLDLILPPQESSLGKGLQVFVLLSSA